MNLVPIIIPAYEPDNRLIELLKKLDETNIGPILIVNDGSGSKYDCIFEKASRIINRLDGKILTHEINRGKGRALKTAFEYTLTNYTDAIAVVTADSDGQHTPECIQKIIDKIICEKDSLVLGIRKFDLEGIPWKSRFGNKLTEKVFTYIAGVHISDTQTGLRGIPKSFMSDLINIKGERFEFEMRMLLEAADNYNIIQVPIETVYESEHNHQTHFNPIKDSLKIYKILGERFLKYIFSSFSSSLVDIIIFYILCRTFKLTFPLIYATIATVLARIISATYNFILNYKIVFKSQEKPLLAAIRYVTLALFQMLLSATLITIIVYTFPYGVEVLFKIFIDTFLFFISYHIQQRVVFRVQKHK